MTTVFLDAVFKPFFKLVHDTGQQLTIDRTNFLTDGFLQITRRMVFVSVNTRFQIPPKKKKITRWKIGRARGPRHVSEMGNEVPGKHFSNNVHWLVCSVRCGTILLKPHIGTVCPSSAQFWVLPIQKMSGPRGSPYTSHFNPYTHSVQKFHRYTWLISEITQWISTKFGNGVEIKNISVAFNFGWYRSKLPSALLKL